MDSPKTQSISANNLLRRVMANQEVAAARPTPVTPAPTARSASPVAPRLQVPVRDFARIVTGIPGYDVLCEGGFRPESINYLVGGPGTGKTILALTYLYHGATLPKPEPGFYITLEQQPGDLIQDMKRFGLDLQPLIDSGLLTVQFYPPDQILKMVSSANNELGGIIETKGIKRVVFDSVTEVGMIALNEPDKRLRLHDIFNILKEKHITALMIAEHQFISLNEYEPEMDEFEADSITCLIHRQRGNTVERGLQIIKMRGTNHNQQVHPLIINENKGISIDSQMIMEE